MPFYVKFWGTRGSIPIPGRRTQKYGGNTACVEINIDDVLYICDGGTGLHELGLDLMNRITGPIVGHMFFSHAHWDHIQGFPFFLPVYREENTFFVYGSDEGETRIYRLLSGQMQSDYFPVDFLDLHAVIVPRALPGGERVIEGVRVRCLELTHKGTCFGYSFEKDGHKVVYATDNELDLQLENPVTAKKDPEALRRVSKQLVDFVRDADLLIADGQYTDEEYETRVGWGHPRATTAVDLAVQAGVKHLAIFHHDPLQSDNDVQKKSEICRARAARWRPDLFVFCAREGIELQID